jgi:hypothetical protein
MSWQLGWDKIRLGFEWIPRSNMNLPLVQSIWSLIQALSQEERGFLRLQLVASEETMASKAVDLNQFSGVITLELDPLVYQHQMRGK